MYVKEVIRCDVSTENNYTLPSLSYIEFLTSLWLLFWFCDLKIFRFSLNILVSLISSCSRQLFSANMLRGYSTLLSHINFQMWKYERTITYEGFGNSKCVNEMCSIVSDMHMPACMHTLLSLIHAGKSGGWAEVWITQTTGAETNRGGLPWDNWIICNSTSLKPRFCVTASNRGDQSMKLIKTHFT